MIPIYTYICPCLFSSIYLSIYIYIYIDRYITDSDIYLSQFLTIDLSVTLRRGCAKQTIFLFVLARNQNKDLSPKSRRNWKWARERQSEEMEKETQRRRWRRVTQSGGRQRTAEETSRHEKVSRSSEGRPVKMSQHSSWLCGNFAKDARQR